MKLVPVDFNRVTQAGMLRVMPAALPEDVHEGEEIRIYEYSEPDVQYVARIVGPHTDAGTLISVDWASETTDRITATRIINFPSSSSHTRALRFARPVSEETFYSQDMIEA